MKNNKYTFKKLCKEIRDLLPPNLHTTKETDTFMWIATETYDIGVYPIHYEIRLADEKVYSEIHYESASEIKTGKGSTACLKNDFKKTIGKINSLTPAIPGPEHSFYQWYRIKESGVDLSDNCSCEVLAEMEKLIKKTQSKILKLMKKVFI